MVKQMPSGQADSQQLVAAVGLPQPVVAALSRGHVATVEAYADSDDFLLSAAPFDYSGFFVRLVQRGVPGLNLIRLIRKRSAAPVVAIVDVLDEGYTAALDAGAAQVVPLAVPSDAWPATLRSILQSRQATGLGAWVLDASARALVAPDGEAIPLGATDASVMALFARAPDHVVGHDALKATLWGSDVAGDLNALHATMYRLRKRIERGGRALAPLQSMPRVGYVFKARLNLREGS